jgi:2-succinyl-6-hydroxy-2,4-cyclohexadiene-1-carboxylate synthase
MLTALHGFTETDESWSEALQPLGCELRCPLLPGHGWRPCPAATTVPSVAAELAAQLPPNSDVLGYSMGGRIALQLALDHPARVRRLVLLSSTAGLSDVTERTRRAKHDSHYAEVLIEDGIGPFVSWWESNPALKPAQPYSRNKIHQLRCLRLNQSPMGLAHALLYLGAGVMPNLWPRLGELRMPVLLMAGAGDQRYAQIMRDMAAHIPQARLEIIDSCGHAIHREQPEAMLSILREFLL